jgi:hypothetical protein
MSHGVHAGGETISSASGGLQEALIAARYVPTNPTGTSQSGVVVVPPRELKAFARVSIRSSNLTVDFSGSILECWMNDTCIFVGDPTNANVYMDITLINPRGRPTVMNGQKPFIEVNAQKTRLFNVSTRINSGHSAVMCKWTTMRRFFWMGWTRHWAAERVITGCGAMRRYAIR